MMTRPEFSSPDRFQFKRKRFVPTDFRRLDTTRKRALAYPVMLPPLRLQTTDVGRILEEVRRVADPQWSFRDKTRQVHAPVYFQYPAMMVAEMQGLLIDVAVRAIPSIDVVLDPFVGSGTVLAESIIRGLCFHGQDINPLSVLLSRIRSGPFFPRVFAKKAQDLCRTIKRDRLNRLELDFPGREKWFQPTAAMQLSRIRRAIINERAVWCRRLYWAALAETVRRTSNSRTTTYKLHIRPKEELKRARENALDTFLTLLNREVVLYHEQCTQLRTLSLIRNGMYSREITVTHGDSSRAINLKNGRRADLLVTSPPYGDNRTTVSYGQNAYLPLRWIELSDISPGLDSQWIRTAYEIDRNSIGGSLSGLGGVQDRLEADSPHLTRILSKLRHVPRDRTARILAYVNDLDKSLRVIEKSLVPGSLMIWTLGNRSVGGILIPLDDIVNDLLSKRGAELVAKIPRIIPSKRMARRNNFSSTMTRETILIVRAGG